MPNDDPIPKSVKSLLEKVVAKVPIVRDPVFGPCLLGAIVILVAGATFGFGAGSQFKSFAFSCVVGFLCIGLFYLILKECGVLRTGEQRKAEHNLAAIFPPASNNAKPPRKQRPRTIDPTAPIVLDPSLQDFCTEHLILAIASGKGGVGKTMLAVACAHELSLGGPTLLLDLDFFNRGLAGLFEKHEPLASLPRPEFLGPAAIDEHREWRLQRIRDDLYHLAYDDLGPAEFKALKAITVGELTHSIGAFLQRAAALIRQTANCTGPVRIILDCHGGPDDISFAASLLARHTLLISEPDRITFRGTEHFLAQLAGLKSDPAPRVHLVFNKIGPAFTAPVLIDLYDKYLRAHFGERELLALFPLEPALSKAFETEPLITRAYPYSLLARKMRFLLVKLLRTDGERYLAPSALTLPHFAQSYRYKTLGRVPWWLDPHRVFPIILTVLAVLVVCEVYGPRFRQNQLIALFRAALNVVATENPQIKLDPKSEYVQFLSGKPPLPSSEKFTANLPRLTIESQFPPHIYSTIFEADGTKSRGISPTSSLKGDGDLVTAAVVSGARLFGEERPQWDIRTVIGISDFNLPSSMRVTRVIEDRSAISHFLERAAGKSGSPAYPQTWDADLNTLHGGNWWEWTIRDAGLWWRANYFNGVMFSLLWLGVGLCLDCTRQLDARFTRNIRVGHGSGVGWLMLGIGLWVAPVLFANVAFSKSETDADFRAMQVAVGLIVLPYLVVAIHQMYRCWRIGSEGLTDWRVGRGQAIQWESRVAGRLTHLLGGPMELWFRATFISVILGSAAALIFMAAAKKALL